MATFTLNVGTVDTDATAIILSLNPAPSASEQDAIKEEIRQQKKAGTWVAGGFVPTISTAATLAATQGTAFSHDFGAEVDFDFLTGTVTVQGLPSGLTDNGDGTVTGTPLDAGNTNISVIALNSIFQRTTKIVQVQAAASGSAPGEVTNVSVSPVDDKTLSVTFTAAPDAASHQLRWAPKINQTAGPVSTGWWSAPEPITSGGNFSAPLPDRTFEVQVRGVNDAGDGNWSTVATGATSAATDNCTGAAEKAASGDAHIDGIIEGSYWTHSSSPKIMTVSFPTSSSFYKGPFATPYLFTISGFRAFTTSEQDKMMRILSRIEKSADIRFQKITEDATHTAMLRFAYCTSIPGGLVSIGFYPGAKSPTGGGGNAGDAWFNPTQVSDPVVGTNAWFLYNHEALHTLGLTHTHDGTAIGTMPSETDAHEFTVMTYRSYVGGPIEGVSNETFGFPTTPMMYDIAALQYLYGANYNSDAGDTVHSWNSINGAYSINGVVQETPGANRIFMTVWDGGGSDTYDLTQSSYGAGTITADLTPGASFVTATGQRASLGAGNFAENIYNAVRFGGSTASDIEMPLVP